MPIDMKEIALGEARLLQFALPKLYGQAEAKMHARILRGVKEGPQMLIAAAVHGDEVNGAEIIRQLLLQVVPESLAGTLIAVPVVNVFAFLDHSRYMPDRSDLNRMFPGSPEGSLGARYAHFFFEEVVRGCTHLIDCHSAASTRTNLPQVRGDLDDQEVLEMAEAFGAPAMMPGKTRDGALRTVACKAGIKTLLYEAGAPNRFNRDAIECGVQGILRVMAVLGMIEEGPEPPEIRPRRIEKSYWIRAPDGGFFHPAVELGVEVEEGAVVGFVCDCSGENACDTTAGKAGVVLGTIADPQVNPGDAVVHVGVPKQ